MCAMAWIEFEKREKEKMFKNRHYDASRRETEFKYYIVDDGMNRSKLLINERLVKVILATATALSVMLMQF